jgi:hypothetical protein
MMLFGAAAAQWQTAHPIFHFWDEVMRERWQTAASEQLGNTAEEAFDTGQRGIEAAVAYALTPP